MPGPPIKRYPTPLFKYCKIVFKGKCEMAGIIFYFWLFLLLLYILSPLDMHPMFFDDLIALAVLLYLVYRNFQKKKQSGYSYTYESKGYSERKENRAKEDI
jgi:uncharacterized membrane protein YkvA (DUF1232 family)